MTDFHFDWTYKPLDLRNVKITHTHHQNITWALKMKQYLHFSSWLGEDQAEDVKTDHFLKQMLNGMFDLYMDPCW